MKCLQTIHLQSKQTSQALKQRTLTKKLTNIYAIGSLQPCGDANAMMGTKHIDLSLCSYLGAYLMCIDNKHLKDKVPRGNGTLCQVLDFKLNYNAPSH
jgi:hypothetical protein